MSSFSGPQLSSIYTWHCWWWALHTANQRPEYWVDISQIDSWWSCQLGLGQGQSNFVLYSLKWSTTTLQVNLLLLGYIFILLGLGLFFFTHFLVYRVLCTRVDSDTADALPVFTETDPNFCVDITSTKDCKFITINSNSRTTSEEGYFSIFLYHSLRTVDHNIKLSIKSLS